MAQAGRPKLSIITVTFNAASTIEACIESVLRHKGDDVEFVVIDGGSKDGTVEILERYGKAIDVLVSERDSGIYDAMNKGLDRACGEYVLFLGGDDALLYVPRRELATGPDLLLCTVDCGLWKFRHSGPLNALMARMRYRNRVHSQGAFYKQGERRFELAYRYCSDYQFSLGALREANRVDFSEEVVSLFSVEGASSHLRPKLEMIAISKRNFGLFWATISAGYCIGSFIVDKAKRAYR